MTAELVARAIAGDRPGDRERACVPGVEHVQAREDARCEDDRAPRDHAADERE